MRARAIAAPALLLALLAGPLAAGAPVAGEADATDAVTSATQAAAASDATPEGPTAAVPAPDPTRTTTGGAIYERFVEGLAQPECDDASPRWSAHYAHVPAQLVADDSEVLPLFGYVVEALRAAHLPTEYALIPFVESGYRPGARSSAGPAGMWQFIALTARNHGIPVSAGYDGRLSPADATRAAVRYLRTLHGMFAGDWRLAAMAFNAGEHRVLGALRRHGQRAADARPEALESLSGITQAYVRKLHALSCLMVEAGGNAAWTAELDRPVARLVSIDVGSEPAGLDGYAKRHQLDAARLRRLNPGIPGGSAGGPGRQALVPAAAAVPAAAGMAN